MREPPLPDETTAAACLNLWLGLDALFATPRRIAPFADAPAGALRPHGAAAVCDPLLGGAFLAQLVAHALGTDFCFTERVMAAEPGGPYRARYRLPRAFRERLRGQRAAAGGRTIPQIS